MALPKTYSLIVRHDFGANAVVTADFIGVDKDLNYDASATAVFTAAVVADNTDVESADYSNATNGHIQIAGNLSVQGQSGNVTGAAELWLRTKTGLNSDSQQSQLVAAVHFSAEQGPKIRSFSAHL